MTGFGIYKLWSRGYPSRGQLFGTALRRATVLRSWLRITPTPRDCADPTVVATPLADRDVESNLNLPTDANTEHPIDVCYLYSFMRSFMG